MPSTVAPAVAADIRTRVKAIRARIDAACQRAGRSASDVRLIAVTKTFPLGIVHAAVEAGLTNFGENRVQELEEKGAKLPGAIGGGAVHWHLIGPLQKNKINKALEFADTFHALDSDRLAEHIDKRAARAGRVLPCYVQVNVSGEDSKSGVLPCETHAFLDRLAQWEHLRVVGLMALAAPVSTDEERETIVRPQFRRLRTLAETYGGKGKSTLERLSMGMSGDFEIAVEEGATDVRVGSALFGARPEA